MNLSELRPLKCGIYKIENIQTKRSYIGQSIDIESRWHQHVRDLVTGKHVNKKMLSDFQEYGLSSFEATILEECEKEFLDNQETLWALRENEANLYNNTTNLKNYKKLLEKEKAHVTN